MQFEQVTEFFNDKEKDNIYEYDLKSICIGHNSTRKTSIGDISNVETDGCIADGQEYTTILSVGDIFVAIPCCFSSWDESSYEFDKAYQVYPKEKTITVYERVA